MAKQVKCPICGCLNDKDDTVKIKTRYYCKNTCGPEEIERQKHQDKKNKDWSELFEYICEIYEIDTLTGMMFKQLKDFRDQYNYTNKGIYLTLKYFYEIEGGELKEDAGLGIVVWYYEKAKKHYIEQLKINKHEKNFEEHEEVKIIEIDLNVEDYVFKSPLSFDNIEWEDGEDE